MEPLTRFELVHSVWKTDMLTVKHHNGKCTYKKWPLVRELNSGLCRDRAVC